jgi:signal transduction histidine kinase
MSPRERSLSEPPMASRRGGIIVNLVGLSILLVAGTSAVVAGALIWALSGQIEQAAPESAILGGLRAVLLPVLAATLVAMLLGSALAYRLARRVRDPILDLAAATARQRAGDLATPVPSVEEAELAVLAHELELARGAAQQRLDEAARREAQQVALFAALREPAILVSREGRVTGFNPAAQSFFGGTARLYGRPIQQLLPFVAPPSEVAGQPADVEGRAVDATGRTVDLDVSLAWLPDSNDAACCVYVMHNVSRFAQLNRLREQLLYSVAHELRGPLAILDTALELLTSEGDSMSADERDHLVQSAGRTVTRLTGLMEDMLSAGAIQSGRFVVRAQPVELAPIIDDAIEATGLALESRNQRVETDPIDRRVLVQADRRYARQVLMNLLTNASKYSPDGKAIRVSATVAGGEATIAVIDHGHGIPVEEQAGLFDRFYRVRPGNEEPGIGLGLAIAKGIVDAHGGRIGLQSEPGGGTVVWFTLPIAREEGASDR